MGLYRTTYNASCLASVVCTRCRESVPAKVRLKMPGVKSIGPDSMRVNGSVAVWAGGLGGSPQALYSCPRAPSRDSQFGYVRLSPVSLIGSCVLMLMRRRAAALTESR